ncbi:MAG: hypothetical protein U9R14_01490 [Patescibacteria group bacterium]|nr:hypothetical protein [Patescibacteria group bacterium]
MDIALFKKIPEWFKQMIEEFEDSTLDFWFWGLITRESNNIINFCARKYAGEIKEDIFAFSAEIKIKIAVLQTKIKDLKLKRELDEIRQIIGIELSDIQLFIKQTTKTKNTEAACGY